MHTEHVNILLPEYLRGRLGAEQSSAVAEHLRCCQTCRMDLADLEETLSALEPVNTKVVSGSYFTSILPRVHQRLERNRKKSWMAGPFVEKILLPLGAAAVLLVVMMRLPGGWNGVENENPLQPVVGSASVEEIAEILQENVPTQGAGSLNTALLTQALADDQFVQDRIVSEALNSESTSPFSVFADVTPQQVLSDLAGPEADKMIQRLQEMEIL